MTKFPEQAQISWIEETIPLSSRFDDTYYSKSDGQLETRHVFIEGNKLPARWQNKNNFTIGELGFGTGLNFLETVRQWELQCDAKAQLNYFSFEQYPLSRQQIQNALSRWRSLDVLSGKLCNIWEPGENELEVMFTPQVRLIIKFGDANHTLQTLKSSVDAWYLDGFSPAKNPELWNLELMQQVYDHTAPQGTFATYTVAGYVRRNLQHAGFVVARQNGFGSKREMLMGNKV